MELNYPHNDINELLKFSNKLQLQNNKKLPKNAGIPDINITKPN